jgi:hypothetical protein
MILVEERATYAAFSGLSRTGFPVFSTVESTGIRPSHQGQSTAGIPAGTSMMTGIMSGQING